MTPNQQSHTPTPWKQWIENKDFIVSGETTICEVYNRGNYMPRKEDEEIPSEKQGKANASFIVRAVNSHSELLEACKLASRWFEKLIEDKDFQPDDELANLLDKAHKPIKEAIANAEAQQ